MKEDPEETIRSRGRDGEGTSSEVIGDDAETGVGICVALLVLSAGVVMYVVFAKAAALAGESDAASFLAPFQSL